jgi:hypothetical protein
MIWEKEIKGIQIGKVIKLPLLADNMISQQKDSKISAKDT